MRFLPYVIVDVFTDTPLEGNALGVFPDASELTSDLMQRAARELNLSETVFILGAGPDSSGADARVRIFTPTSELPFAGHPILGAACVLGERLGTNSVRLVTEAAEVPVSLRSEGGETVFGEMDQPVPTREEFGRVPELLAALGVERSELPVDAYRNGPLHVYVALGSEDAVAALRPDMRALEALNGPFGVSCFAGAGDRYRTRMFAPSLGVPEDPATGSAAGPLALHVVRHGRLAYGHEVSIRQGGEIGRPSLLRARIEGTEERIDRVVVGGSAVIVARGEYRLQ